MESQISEKSRKLSRFRQKCMEMKDGKLFVESNSKKNGNADVVERITPEIQRKLCEGGGGGTRGEGGEGEVGIDVKRCAEGISNF